MARESGRPGSRTRRSPWSSRVTRTARPPWSGASWTPSATGISNPPTCSTGAATRSHASSGFCREQGDHRPHRRAAVHRLDAGLHARLRPRVPRLARAPWTRGSRATSSSRHRHDDATPESIESYMREDNDRMLRLLCIHEGVPGHYLQLAWSNRSPSLIRTIFGDGMFAEGWAVLRRAGDDGPGLRRRRPGAHAHPLEVRRCGRSPTPSSMSRPTPGA